MTETASWTSAHEVEKGNEQDTDETKNELGHENRRPNAVHPDKKPLISLLFRSARRCDGMNERGNVSSNPYISPTKMTRCQIVARSRK